MKNRESIIKLAVKDYKERNSKNVHYTVHDALYYSLEEHDARDMSQDEWEDLLWTIEKKVNKPTLENVIKDTIDSSRIEEERKRIFLDNEEDEEDEERFFILWKWDNEIYEVIGETENEYSVINISSGYKAKANKDEVIRINNM